MSLRLRVEVRGLDDAVAKLEYFRKASQRLGRRVLSREGKRLKRLIWFFAPQRTGALRSSIRVFWGTNTVTVSVGGGSVNYVPYVEYGVRPHRIPKTGYKLLRWVDEEGQVHYAMRVYHPGYRGRHFLRRAMEEFVRGLWRRYKAEVDAEMFPG